MPFQHLRQPPACMLIFAPIRCIFGQTNCESLHQWTRSLELSRHALARLAGFGGRSRYCLASEPLQLLAPLFQPIAQPMCRYAIVTIVAFNRLAKPGFDIRAFLGLHDYCVRSVPALRGSRPKCQHGFEGLESEVCFF